jgi:hypothetical protein
MLLLLQAATQAPPPPIHVIVEKMPEVSGLPEWAKLLISAGVGAIFGILSTLVTESIKARRSKHSEMKKLTGQLVPELKENLDQVETLKKMTDRASEGTRDDRGMTLSFARDILPKISSDRYVYNFDNQKALVYEVAPQRQLGGFYNSVVAALDAAGKLDYGGLLHYVRRASEQGRSYLKERGVEYTPTPNDFYDRLVQVEPGDNPESWFHEITNTGAFAPKD